MEKHISVWEKKYIKRNIVIKRKLINIHAQRNNKCATFHFASLNYCSSTVINAIYKFQFYIVLYEQLQIDGIKYHDTSSFAAHLYTSRFLYLCRELG